MTDAELIKKYISLRDYIERESAAFTEKLQPYNAALDAISGTMMLRLNENRQQSVKTEHGTVYKTTTLSARVADRESFLDYVFAHKAEQFLTSHVAKDACKEYLDGSGGQPPPGIDVTYITKVNFRRA